MFKEFKKLNNGGMTGKTIFGTINPDGLTTRKKQGASGVVNLVKQKIIRKTKRIKYVDGSKKTIYYGCDNI